MHLATTEDDERCWGELQTMWQPQLAGRPYICLNPGGAFGFFGPLFETENYRYSDL